MRKVTVVASLTLLHATVSFGVFLAAFGAASARLDSGRVASTGEQLLGATVQVLHFPLVWLATEHVPAGWLPGLWGYVPLLLNGLLWAGVLVSVATRLVPRPA